VHGIGHEYATCDMAREIRLHTHEAMTMDTKARRSGRFDLQASLFQLRPTVLQDR
jgi:hypothetical protein